MVVIDLTVEHFSVQRKTKVSVVLVTEQIPEPLVDFIFTRVIKSLSFFTGPFIIVN